MDLNYFLYSSVKGCDRKANLDKYLEHYFNEYQNTLKKAQIEEIPFSLQELKDEQRENLLFGAIQGMFLIPLVLVDEEDAIEVAAINDENFEEKMQEWKIKNMKLMTSKPAFKSRFLAVFDDLEEHGYISG